MADMGTKEAAEKWGVSQTQVQKWCREGKIPCATQDRKGSPWHIPKDSQPPTRKNK
jgi:predicted site-specific integrase-resolvase